MAKLTIKVSQPMLKVVKEVCKELSCVDSVCIQKASEGAYQMSVCPMDFWYSDEYDMDECSDGRFKFFQVVYTDDCYAIPRNICTASLLYEFKRRRCSSMDDLKAMLKELIEI